MVRDKDYFGFSLNQTGFVWPGICLTIENDIESTLERHTRGVKTF